MTYLPIVEITRSGRTAKFHGSWYRGSSTNFIPSKAELFEPDGVDRFVLPGWAPRAPVIDKSSEPLWAAAERLAPEGYDVVLDANGVETLRQSYRHVASAGKLVVYGFHTMLPRQGGRPSYPKLAVDFLRMPRFNPLDLCNDNSGTPVGPGLHSLRIVVTDRPWYRPIQFDADGKPLIDATGVPLRVEDEASARIGVPDTPAGASYAIADYVFACGDNNDPDAGCNCAVPEMP